VGEEDNCGSRRGVAGDRCVPSMEVMKDVLDSRRERRGLSPLPKSAELSVGPSPSSLSVDDGESMRSFNVNPR
jgi:hypothetical protein